MTLAQRLAIANIARTDNRALLEDASVSATQSTTRGRLIDSNQNGHTFETANGGTITVSRTATDAENFSPTIGATYQLNLSGGAITRLNVASRPNPSTPAPIAQQSIIVADRGPTLNDRGNPQAPWWANINVSSANGMFQAELYAWVPSLGAYAQVSGGAVAGPQITHSTDPPPGGFAGNLSATDPLVASYSPGDRWVNTVLRRGFYLASTGVNMVRWYPDSTKVFTIPPPASQFDSLVDGDTLQIPKYYWYWSTADFDWREGFCCDDGPPNAPTDALCGPDEIFWQPDCAPEGQAVSAIYTCDCLVPQF